MALGWFLREGKCLRQKPRTIINLSERASSRHGLVCAIRKGPDRNKNFAAGSNQRKAQ
jgi:hypothetical protein